MCEMSNWRLRSRYLALCCAACLLSSASQAESTEPTHWQDQTLLVKELMLSESEHLMTPRSTVKEEKTSSTQNTLMQKETLVPTLKAMYGVGKRIAAEVDFDGKSYVYLRGQTWPVGDKAGRSQLRMLAMTSRCVEMAYQEQMFTACVVPRGGM